MRVRFSTMSGSSSTTSTCSPAINPPFTSRFGPLVRLGSRVYHAVDRAADPDQPRPIPGGGWLVYTDGDSRSMATRDRRPPVISESLRGDGLLPPTAYARDDESPDDRFYIAPRKVVHIDAGAIAELGRLYAELLPAGGRLLDLMSCWRSHLPAGFHVGEVIGLGLNAAEMADNPQLTRSIVHDLNRDPRLPFGDEEFDGATCAVSIQYVTHPLLLFREVRRVLRPGAPFVVSFSNRCFPTMAVAVWLESSDQQHLTLVHAYFEAAGGWTDAHAETRLSGDDGDPLYAVWARRSSATI